MDDVGVICNTRGLLLTPLQGTVIRSVISKEEGKEEEYVWAALSQPH